MLCERASQVKSLIISLVKRVSEFAWGDCACTPGNGWVGTPSPFRGVTHYARVAELVDALDSGSSPSNGVQVQLLPRAPLV